MGDDLPVVGDDLAGYVIVREIARGGMGVIFLARHPHLPRTEALKILINPGGQDRAPERFRQEMDLVATLDHPAILPVLNSGESDGRLWFTMPFVDGIDAATMLKQHGALPVPTVLTIVENVAAALDHAHDHGIVHRDVKPANILLKTDPGDSRRVLRVYLTDFGIAKVLQTDRPPLTSTDEAYGTWQYAAPEQFDNRPVDRRTDVYALGAVLFHLLTGTQPFPVHDFMANVALRAQNRQPALTDLRPDLPPKIDDVIRQAMALPPEDRFPKAGDFADRVRSALLDEPSSDDPHDARSFAPTVAGTPTTPREPVVPPPAPRRGRRALAAVVALVLIGGVLLWHPWSGWTHEAGPDPVPTTSLPPTTSGTGDSASTDPTTPTPTTGSGGGAAVAMTALMTPAPTVAQVTVAGSLRPGAVVAAVPPKGCDGDPASLTFDLDGRYSSLTGQLGIDAGAAAVFTGMWIEKDGVDQTGPDPQVRVSNGQAVSFSVPTTDVQQLTIRLQAMGSTGSCDAITAALYDLVGQQ